MKDNARERALEDSLIPYSGTEVDEVPGIKVKVVRVPEHAWRAAMEGLSRNPNIEFVEPDYILEPDMVANDPYFSSSWHLTKTQATSAWDSSVGSSSVVIAILDTGVDSTHPDLAPKNGCRMERL